MRRAFLLFASLAFTSAMLAAVDAESPRHEWLLDVGWRSVADDDTARGDEGFERPDFDDGGWRVVEVPHNWDDYGGAHRVVHGNRHGTAWYRRSFTVGESERGRRVLLFFEGVGSYAKVWINGKPAGAHAGGRTTFTLDVTELIRFGEPNCVAVRADHPAGIKDLPWVCGGCSPTPGFSEGSQPMGIFRPVHLITTAEIRVAPFGVHVWNDSDATEASAKIHFTVEMENTGPARNWIVENRVLTAAGTEAASVSNQAGGPGAASLTESEVELKNVARWSLASPTLYTFETTLRDGSRVLDRVTTNFGVRTIHWPDPAAPESAPFLLNGHPVFINGTCEYEHLLGASHAFGEKQIQARVAQTRAAGFNAFRDAHQPHNLRYQNCWDRDGLLWWPQFAAQIWFDTPEFRANFKTLLREWVRERRNSPSLVLWGLANESKLPPDFAAECVAIIRELDPTSPSQRLVTTCNSGKGTDWNVPQNWSGTYAGNPDDYAADLLRQRLVGEYGAWRSLGLHTEGGFVRNGPLSEERNATLLERKIQLAESVRDRVPGHFHWLLATHDNPGRTINAKLQQGGDGWAESDRIGPANNKGLLTLWGEPTDAFYLYRANYAPAATDPMVYLVSHTWPERWSGPGRKGGLVVYSNCDEVELFNDVRDHSLGVRRRGGPGTHFAWEDVEIDANVLYAEGRIGGKVVATDAVVLKNLPDAPHRRMLNAPEENLTVGATGQNYLYRINCGGQDYTDVNGQRWQADSGGANWESQSWSDAYPDVPADFGSRRVSAEPIKGTADEALFQAYRYGRHALKYRFGVPEGEYRVELYFMEPWYGAGGGDCAGWRLFDVAVNGTTVLRDVDLWKEAGFAHAVKKVVTARVTDGVLEISFPRVASYQAVISAIAVSTANTSAMAPATLPTKSARPALEGNAPVKAPVADTGAQWLPIGQAPRSDGNLGWSVQLGLGGAHEFRVRYFNATARKQSGEFSVYGTDGVLVGKQAVDLPPTNGGAAETSLAAMLTMNAGDYTIRFSLAEDGEAGAVIQGLLVK